MDNNELIPYNIYEVEANNKISEIESRLDKLMRQLKEAKRKIHNDHNDFKKQIEIIKKNITEIQTEINNQ